MMLHSEFGNVAVYTAITNNRDMLKEPRYVNDFQYICFSDRPVNSKVWKYRPIQDTRFSYRECKILVMKYFSEFDYSIWQDGSMMQKADLTPLLKNLTSDIAIFPHRERDNIYDEVEACVRLNKWDANALHRQAWQYRKQDFISDGLFETGIIIRRHTEDIMRLGEIWWEEIQRHTPRDQISLPYALWKMNMKCMGLVGSVSNNAYFEYYRHNS